MTPRFRWCGHAWCKTQQLALALSDTVIRGEILYGSFLSLHHEAGGESCERALAGIGSFIRGQGTLWKAAYGVW